MGGPSYEPVLTSSHALIPAPICRIQEVPETWGVVLLMVTKMAVRQEDEHFVVWSVNYSGREDAHHNCTLNLDLLC